jgi:hypothetical protein
MSAVKLDAVAGKCRRLHLLPGRGGTTETNACSRAGTDAGMSASEKRVLLWPHPSSGSCWLAGIVAWIRLSAERLIRRCPLDCIGPAPFHTGAAGPL